MSQHQAKIKSPNTVKSKDTTEQETTFDKKNTTGQKQFSGADDSTEPNWASVQARMNLPGPTASKNFPEKSQPVQRKVPANTNPLSISTYSSQQTNYQPASNPRTGMPATVQHKMETAFNTSFDDVKIHVGSQAKKIGALAYTQGNHIHFAPGHYNPHSQKGQELLGHELAHVMQQRQGRVKAMFQAKGTSINNNSTLEKEADHAGKKVAQGNMHININYYDMYSNTYASSMNIANSSLQPIQAKFLLKKDKQSERYDECTSVNEFLSYAEVDLNELIRSDLPSSVEQKVRDKLEEKIKNEEEFESFSSPKKAKRYIEGLINNISPEESPISNLYGHELIFKALFDYADIRDFANLSVVSRYFNQLSQNETIRKVILLTAGFSPENRYYNPFYNLYYSPEEESEKENKEEEEEENEDEAEKAIKHDEAIKILERKKIEKFTDLIQKSRWLIHLEPLLKPKVDHNEADPYEVFTVLAARSEASILRKILKKSGDKLNNLIRKIESAPEKSKESKPLFQKINYFEQSALVQLAQPRYLKLKAYEGGIVSTRETSWKTKYGVNGNEGRQLPIASEFLQIHGGTYSALEEELKTHLQALKINKPIHWKIKCFLDYLLEPISEIGNGGSSIVKYEEKGKDEIMEEIRKDSVLIRAKILIRVIESLRHEGIFTANLLGILANLHNEQVNLNFLVKPETAIMAPGGATKWYADPAELKAQISKIEIFIELFLKIKEKSFPVKIKEKLSELQKLLNKLKDQPDDEVTRTNIIATLIEVHAYFENIPILSRQETEGYGSEHFYRIGRVLSGLENNSVSRNGGGAKNNTKKKSGRQRFSKPPTTNLFNETPESERFSKIYSLGRDFLIYVFYIKYKSVQKKFFDTFCNKVAGANITPKYKNALLQFIGVGDKKIDKKVIPFTKQLTLEEVNALAKEKGEEFDKKYQSVMSSKEDKNDQKDAKRKRADEKEREEASDVKVEKSKKQKKEIIKSDKVEKKEKRKKGSKRTGVDKSDQKDVKRKRKDEEENEEASDVEAKKSKKQKKKIIRREKKDKKQERKKGGRK